MSQIAKVVLRIVLERIRKCIKNEEAKEQYGFMNVKKKSELPYKF